MAEKITEPLTIVGRSRLHGSDGDALPARRKEKPCITSGAVQKLSYGWGAARQAELSAG
jgi:hypothetical protein